MPQPQFRHKSKVDQRRDDVKRINDMTVKVTHVTGRVLIIGTGEVAVDVPLPVYFSERPVFTFGGELNDNNSATSLSYPTISAVVTGWTKAKEEEGVAEGYYVGASIAVVTTGTDGQEMWLHYSFEAKALRNPLVGLESLEEPI